MLEPRQAIVTVNANLRAGPGTNFGIVGTANLGESVGVVARNSTGDWLQLVDGAWIAAFLVENSPANLPTSNDRISLMPNPTQPTITTTSPAATAVPISAQVPLSSSASVGVQIAFLSDRDHLGRSPEIYVMNADGSQQSRLTTNVPLGRTEPEHIALDGQFAWSPAHQKYFYLMSGTLYSLEADGTRPSIIADDLSLFDISPDGQKIAYWHSGGINEIGILNIDGTGRRDITDASTRAALGLAPETHFRGPVWSSDGKQILFYDWGNDIFLMNADGSEPKLIATVKDLGSAAKTGWSPDGRYVVFAQNNIVMRWFDLYILDRARSSVDKLVDNGFGPAWSPDGAQIVFSKGDLNGNEQIWTISPTGSDLTQLTFEGTSNCCAQWISAPYK